MASPLRNSENFTSQPTNATQLYWALYGFIADDLENHNEFDSFLEGFVFHSSDPDDRSVSFFSEGSSDFNPAGQGRPLSRRLHVINETRVELQHDAPNFSPQSNINYEGRGLEPHTESPQSQPQPQDTSIPKRTPIKCLPHLRPKNMKRMIATRDVDGDCAITTPIPEWKKHAPRIPSQLRMEYKPELELEEEEDNTSVSSSLSSSSDFDSDSELSGPEPMEVDVHRYGTQTRPIQETQSQPAWTPPYQFRGPRVSTQNPIRFEGGGMAYPMDYTTPSIWGTQGLPTLNSVPNNIPAIPGPSSGISNRSGKQVAHAGKHSAVNNSSPSGSGRQNKENRGFPW